MMEDIYEKILNDGYGLKPYGIIKTRGGVIVKSRGGLKELKRLYSDEKLSEFESEAREHLVKNGFCEAESYIRSISGKGYYIYNGTAYAMTEYCEKRPFELGEKNNLDFAAEKLASLHMASKDFDCGVNVSNIGKIPVIYEKRKNELMRTKKRISKFTSFSEADVVILKEYEYYRDLAEEACAVIKSSGYLGIAERAEKERSFCHNSYKGENICMTEKGFMVTGFSKCAYDAPVCELADFIRRALKNGAGAAEAGRAIGCYSKVRGLAAEELKVMYGMLCFPHRFLKIVNSQYNKRRSYVSAAAVDIMKACGEESRRSRAQLSELRKIIGITL